MNTTVYSGPSELVIFRHFLLSFTTFWFMTDQKAVKIGYGNLVFLEDDSVLVLENIFRKLKAKLSQYFL